MLGASWLAKPTLKKGQHNEHTQLSQSPNGTMVTHLTFLYQIALFGIMDFKLCLNYVIICQTFYIYDATPYLLFRAPK